MKHTSIILISSIVLIFAFLAINSFDLNENQKDTKSGIIFKHITIDEAIKLAKAKNKLIFIDAYADWCGPCKRLAKTTFVDSNVANQFNLRYINVKINVDEPSGKAFSAQYGVESLPTLLFIDSTGKVVKSSIGLINARELLTLTNSLK